MDSSWLFNLGADVYAWFTAQPAWRASCARVASRLSDLGASRAGDGGGGGGDVWVADLGCGPGVSTFELSRHLPGARLIGLDIAPRMLGEARRRRHSAGVSHARIAWLQADAANLPLSSASLDACTGHSFLYLVAHRRAVLNEIRRVLRPGGRLVLMEPNALPVTVAQALAVSRNPRHLVSVSLWRPFSRLHGRFTTATLTATLTNAGFVNCRTEETLGGLGVLAYAEAPQLKSLFIHLRLHFQLLLAPVFLWGCLIAGGGLTWSVGLGFVALHAFLYSGATAFNSYYDRDVGPVGGLERPPTVIGALLPFSLGVQAIGLLLAVFVNLPFVLAYCVFAALSLAYSHPRVRLKAHTLTSLVVVGFGQGVLAFLAAWAALRGEVGSAWSLDGALGILSSALLILAMYPLTQLYQIDEDAARGDRTLAVAWGPSGAFAFALACTIAGGALLLALVALRFGVVDASIVTLGLAAQVGFILWMARSFDPRNVLNNYRRVMRANAVSASALGGYVLVRLALGWLDGC